MARKLKNLKVEFISLVKRPANGKGLILKNIDGRIEEIKLTKFNDEMRRAYGIVYAPDQVDSQEDYTDAEEIRKAADDFMLNGRMKNVDTNHDFKPNDAFVAEQWLTKENDSVFPDEPVGAWAVGIQANTDSLWSQIKKGDLVGISLAGTATSEPAQKDETPGWFTKFINNFQKKDQDMDKEAEKKLNDRMEAIETALTKLQKSIDNKDVKAGQDDDKGGDKDKEDVTDAVEKAVLKAKTEILTDMNKTLAEALAKGQSATAKPGTSVESEMV